MGDRHRHMEFPGDFAGGNAGIDALDSHADLAARRIGREPFGDKAAEAIVAAMKDRHVAHRSPMPERPLIVSLLHSAFRRACGFHAGRGS